MKRLIITLCAAVMLALCGPFLLTPSGEYQYLEYTVHTGDTVWSICETYYDCQTKTMQEFVYEVQQKNTLTGKHIRPGQKLMIPLWVRVKEESSR